MTDPSVRKTKRADELAKDDWVLTLTSLTLASKVLTAYPYNDGDDRVMVVYEDPDGRPATLHLSAASTLPLAAFAEISAVNEDKRRYAVADQLRSLALLIDDTVLPMPQRYASNPKLEFHLDDLATVEYVADKLGVEIKVDSAGRHSAYYRPAGKDSLVAAEWFVYVEKAAGPKPDADPTGLGYSREAEPDDNRPVSPDRVPLHTGAMVDGNQLVDETGGR
jgi:hypothetical protein